MPSILQVSAVIPIDTALSQAIPAAGAVFTAMGIWMPAAWTAAALSFEASIVNTPTVDGDWRSVRSGATELTVTTAAGYTHTLNPLVFPPGAKWFRVVSGVAGARVNQAAERIVALTLFRN